MWQIGKRCSGNALLL